MSTTTSSITVKSLLSYLLRVSFGVNVAKTESVFDVGNYVLTPVDQNSNEVRVLEVFTDLSENSVTYVDLKISKPTLDGIYSIQINNLMDSSGQELVNIYDKIKIKYTKADSMSNHMSRMFSQGVHTTITHLFIALGLGDEGVGGQGGLSARPSSASSSSIWGIAYWGVDDWGG